MRRFFAVLLACSALFISGCGNLSPRQDQDIQNQNGRIGEIENITNGMKSEIGTLKSQAEITNSKLDRIQQGLANFQSNYENSGIQILSGPGGLMFALIALFGTLIIALHYRNSAKLNLKTADMLAERIVSLGIPDLEDQIFQAAMYTEVEEHVLGLIGKHQKNQLTLRASAPVLRPHVEVESADA